VPKLIVRTSLETDNDDDDDDDGNATSAGW